MTSLSSYIDCEPDLIVKNESVFASLPENTEWRQSYQTLNERLKYALKTNVLPKDVTFILDQGEKISAHKFVLSLSSKVFSALLANPTEVIHITNTDSLTFHSFLGFIYTEELDVESSSNASIFSLLKLAKKYEIISLIRKCFEIMNENVTIDNCLNIMQAASEFSSTNNDYQQFHDKAFYFILRNGTEVLESTSFRELTREDVVLIVRDNQLAASESTIFQAIYKWAEWKCIKESYPPTPEMIREKMGELVTLVRYPMMMADEFTLNVISKGILSPEEKVEILQYISVSKSLKPSFLPMTFSVTPRNGLAIKNSTLKLDKRIIISYTDSVLQQSTSINHSKIVLTNCSLDLNVFVTDLSAFQLKIRRQIESLCFNNVILENSIDNPIIQYIKLPNLKNFTFKMITSPSDGTEDHKLCNLVRNQVGRFLFFTKKAKHYPWPWSTSYLWNFNVNILLSVNEVILLMIDHEKGDVVINELNPLCSIVKSIPKSEGVRNLSITFNESDASDRMETPSIESIQILTLHNAYRLSDLVHYLRGFPILTDLVLYQCQYQKIEIFDAIISIETLQNLSIGKAKISLISNTHLFFPAVEKLALWNCLWDDNCESNFASTFSNLKEISIYNSFHDKPLYKLVNIILQMKNIEKITISGYVWGIGQSRELITEEESLSGSKLELQVFFASTGVNKNQHLICLVKNHEKEGEIKFHREIDYNIGTNWIAYVPSHIQLEEQMYQQFNFNKFYLDFETFLVKQEFS